MQSMTREQVLDMFCKDMEHPLIQLALHSSFKKWATRRDQLAAKYSEMSGIPEDDFLSAYAVKSLG